MPLSDWLVSHSVGHRDVLVFNDYCGAPPTVGAAALGQVGRALALKASRASQ